MITFIVQYLFVTYVKRTDHLQKLINILVVPTLSLCGLSITVFPLILVYPIL